MLDDVDAVVITLRGGGPAHHELAATDRWGHLAEELQYTTGEGPSVTAFTSGEPVAVADLAEYAGTWPGFVDAAAERGVGAVFAFPLATAAAGTLGTMTLYRRDPGLPPAGLADAGDLAELLADALAVSGATVIEQVRSSTAYEDVNIAAGLLSAQQSIDTEEASARLRATAFASGRPLAEVACEIVTGHLRG